MKKIFLSVVLTASSAFLQLNAQKINPANYDKFIKEVYSETPYMTNELNAKYIQNMKRVEVKKWDKKNHPILESVYMVTKYNPTLKYDSGKDFNPFNFNPLKYFFDYSKPQTYRVSNSDYMIVITP